MSRHTLQPVILCGGSGTRLWPLSRSLHPKQLLSLMGSTTLLQDTLLRVNGLGAHLPIPVEQPVLVANEEHRFLVADQARRIGLEPARIILEPVGRNTAPALTLAAADIRARLAQPDGDTDPVEPILLVLPSDHVIRNESAFRRAVARAVDLAAGGHIVSFGVVPNRPETGYGYLELGRELDDARDGGPSAFLLNSFVEKPDRDTAADYVGSNRYLWNSGMLMVAADAWMHQVEIHQPTIAEVCARAYRNSRSDSAFIHVDGTTFGACPSDSIDYAVLEKLTANGDGTGRSAVVPLDAGWSDVGAWHALWEIQEKDGDGNAVQGDVYARQVSNSLLHAQQRLLVALGVKDMVIVETADAILVAHKDHAHELGGVTQWLKQAGRSEGVTHPKVYRPWGAYECIDHGERYKVKRITVEPGASLSLQMHHHRAEHWIVVKGTARVVRGDETMLVAENESTFIPLGVRHRLENPGSIPIEMIEVQSGAYLEEDDIVRLDDRYGRIETHSKREVNFEGNSAVKNSSHLGTSVTRSTPSPAGDD